MRHDLSLRKPAARRALLICRRPGGSDRGFTLVELIAIMIVIGILAIAVLPRFGAIGGITARGYADQLEAYLRYAQKSAIAQRRPVRVEISGGAAPVLCIAAAPGASCPAACDGSNALATPLSFRSADGVASTAGVVCFDSLGRPGAGQSFAVSESGGALARTIVIEAESGYVHAE